MKLFTLFDACCLTQYFKQQRKSKRGKYIMLKDAQCIHIVKCSNHCSLFHMKIPVSVAKSSHQDYTYTLLFCCKIKSSCAGLHKLREGLQP